MKNIFIVLFFLLSSYIVLAQEVSARDTIKVLDNIVVNAYESNTGIINVATALSEISSHDLARYDNTSFVQAINTKPGIRMDERSPGSYRLNIRGSSMRSPFGISNVKIYYNGIPLTGPGGSTDLNMLGFYNIHSMEIIKGPAGSMYGAGTGGAVLIKSTPDDFIPGFSVRYNTGSYNLQNADATIRFGTSGSQNTLQYQHLNSDGYREHTAMHRDIVSWDTRIKSSEKTELQSHFYYSNLFYQTPGALTKTEYNANPRASRPKSGIFPSAEEAHASIHDQAFLAGFSLSQVISPLWKNNTTVYGYYWRHNNPTFRNYTRRVEPNFGARTNFQYHTTLSNADLTINTGAEFQQSFITSRLYDNNSGNPGNMQTDDEVNNTVGFAFGQVNVEIPSGWVFTGGISLNKSKVNFNRFSTSPAENEERSFKNELAPRLAVMKKLNKSWSVYSSISRGFSPPASGELLPTSGVFNTMLQAESGVNYEVGTKGSFLLNRLFIDISAFRYSVKNTIVQKQDTGGGIYYDNAGSTRQNGIEAYLSFVVLDQPMKFFDYGFIYVSNTWNHFRYKQYKQLTNDFSGNKMTGVSPETFAAGIDLTTRSGLYTNACIFYSGKIPLNDANTAFANSYLLLSLKVGYKTKPAGKIGMDLFGGVQNILNETYSLGNDINAAGGRYYNAAPGRNYYAGVSFSFDRKQHKH